jgi:hypothetical protein
MLVYIDKDSNSTKGIDEKWYYTKYAYQASTKIFFVNYSYRIDLKVFFIKCPYQAK